MTRQRSIIDRIDRLCAWLFLAPFFLMMLIPASVMPTRGADGQLVLAICTGDGPITVSDPAADPGKARAPCDWAMGHDAAARVDMTTTPQPMVYVRAVPVGAVALWRPTHDTRSAHARGPPAIL
jgi:hypothetical protein